MFNRIPGVTFGDIHSYLDWKVYWNGWHITAPEPQRSTVEIPFRNGLLDVTGALTDKIFYKTRTITMDFITDRFDIPWPELESQINDDIHGKSFQLIRDTDPDYYWDVYNCEVGEPNANDGLLTFSVECECFPYKLKREETQRTVLVTGSNISVSFDNSRMEVIPTFITDQQVQMKWTDKHGSTSTIAMSAGTHSYENVEFVEGTNTVAFNKVSNNATVKVVFREGKL